MHKDYFTFLGSSSQDNWVKIVDREYETFVAGNVPPNSYWWNVAPDEVSPTTDLCVRVISEDPANNSLPPFVREAAGIVYLDIPLRFIPYLKPGDIPSSVRTLVLDGEGDCEIDRAIALPHVERLQVNYGKLLFAKRNFPEIHHLHLHFDRKRTMLSQLASFRNLVVLGIQPCSSSMFDVLDKLHLRYLRLNNSRSESLGGIERLETLTDLWLQSWTNIVELTPLAQLPLLEDLSLSYCKRIANADALLAIPSLRRLFAWQCKSKAIEALVPSLASRNLENLSVS